ncbi:hypothetical protein [Halomonas caseinilytica]|uniref:hypothetical protein n=1 Tax=Halomonas caseinilytica TaxID=438744 RepID=UPI0007E57A33|nr:hypothetical protein [Halomonas caseinilytica]SEM32174.1 hypothetical protein SAMN04487952_10311 [Halomonas caseinilytica]
MINQTMLSLWNGHRDMRRIADQLRRAGQYAAANDFESAAEKLAKQLISVESIIGKHLQESA